MRPRSPLFLRAMGKNVVSEGKEITGALRGVQINRIIDEIDMKCAQTKRTESEYHDRGDHTCDEAFQRLIKNSAVMKMGILTCVRRSDAGDLVETIDYIVEEFEQNDTQLCVLGLETLKTLRGLVVERFLLGDDDNQCPKSVGGLAA